VTVYVDDMRVPARAGRGRPAVWSHLTADTELELHEFAARLGLRRCWYQQRCRTCRGVCVHWHYDVTEPVRARAVRLGALEVTMRQMGDLVRARRTGGGGPAAPRPGEHPLDPHHRGGSR